MPFLPEKFVPYLLPEFCQDKEHNPPGMIVLEPGVHTWKCPCCGHEQKIDIPHRSF